MDQKILKKDLNNKKDKHFYLFVFVKQLFFFLAETKDRKLVLSSALGLGCGVKEVFIYTDYNTIINKVINKTIKSFNCRK